MKLLVAGWFSFEHMGATAGDLLVRDLACQWLDRAGCSYDVAYVPPFRGDVDWRTVEPSQYTHVVFVCGPFGNGWPVTDFLSRFEHCRLVGLNLSMLQPLGEWNPFDLLFERDSSAVCRPDASLLAPLNRVPVVGVILCDPVSEYGERSKDEAAHAAIRRLTERREVATVSIDTRLDRNLGGLRTCGEIESLIARMDVVITTRLHGTVLSIKNGVPPVAIDPVEGGGKISSQVRALGWPVALHSETLTDTALAAAFDYCLRPEARTRVAECRERAVSELDVVRETFIRELTRMRNATAGAAMVGIEESHA